jgi:anti-sigma B factor antagonist
LAAAIFTEDKIDGSTLVVSVAGELDISNAPELRRRCSRARAEGISAIVLDFSQLEHMDSSGLAELLAIRAATVAQEGASLVLALGESRLGRVLELRGVIGLFLLAGDRDAAIAAVRGEAAPPTG